MKTNCCDCCYPAVVDQDACGCCEGIEIVTPLPTYNRPGLSQISYRIGTHAGFLETMTARLTGFYLEKLDAGGNTRKYYPLTGLTTRDAADPSLAFLDAWATVADVLTFYQERITNEGYLRTATERRSIVELARLVGYKPRPGVAASVFLAYTVDANTQEEVVIPAGSRSQSIPGPGELPQSFETSEDLKARAQWNNLKPRMTRPQTMETIIPPVACFKADVSFVADTPTPWTVNFTNLSSGFITGYLWDFGGGNPNTSEEKNPTSSYSAAGNYTVTLTVYRVEVDDQITVSQITCVIAIDDNGGIKTFESGIEAAREPRVYLKGISTNLKPNDPLLIDFGSDDQPTLFRIKDVKSDPEADRTLVILQTGKEIQPAAEEFLKPAKVIGELTKPPSVQVSNLFQLPMELVKQFSSQSFLFPKFFILPGMLRVKKGASSGDRYRKINASTISKDKIKFSAVTDTAYAVAKVFAPVLQDTFATAIANAKVTPQSAIKVYALRVKAAPFGHNAPLRPDRFDRERNIVITGEWEIQNPFNQEKPIARFTANPVSGSSPLTVEFTNNSTGDIASYSWDFGNGNKATIRDPVHEFTSAGVYTVTLTIEGPVGNDTTQRKITVSEINIEQPNILRTADSHPQDVSHILLPSEPTFHRANLIYLDTEYNISPNSWAVIEKPKKEPKEEPMVVWLGENSVANQSLAAYGITGKTTRLDISPEEWITDSDSFSAIRGTTIYAQSEELTLAEEPLEDEICGGTQQLIELDGFYEGLEAGRWVIVSGEYKIKGTSGVRISELAMIAEVVQDVQKKENADNDNNPKTVIPAEAEPLQGDKTHTFIKLAKELQYCFKRETVTIHGNVVKATHGETRSEVLGSGDGAKALQTFELKQKPLTHVSAANPSGTDSTLKVFVNNIEWHEVDSLAGLDANDRAFVTRTDNDDKTAVTFGNGREGARLPSGVENIRAQYRNGIGRTGNVRAEQISLLLTKPLGVKEVINPLRASGGADRETRDQARHHVPLAVKALDRLVSTRDYEDFSRVFAGVGKAHAIELSDGRLPLIHVTIAGAGDIPIDANSDLFRNLLRALYDLGDPFQKIQLAVRELLMIVIEAGIAILPDYQWESVVTDVRGALLDQFSFERRELGQDVLLSEVISVMQSVRGVAYVDVDSFGGVPEKQPLTESEIEELTKAKILPPDGRRLLTPDEIADEVAKIISRIQNLTDDQIEEMSESGKLRVPQRLVVNLPVQDKFIRPAQLAFLSPDVPATLILNQIK